MGRLKRRRTLRVGIREQLALLVLLTSLVALAVVSVATWVNNFNFVVGIKSQGLALTASLKAAQVTSFIQLLQTTCNTIVTRVLIQQALQRFYTGNSTDANWVRATSDAQSALASGGYSSLLQIIIYPRNNTGNTYGLLNVTGSGIRPVALPYSYSNGSTVLLGDPGLGYPSMLYPNLTYVSTGQQDPDDNTTQLTRVFAFPDLELSNTTSLFLGPLSVNDTFALVSLTLPIINNTSSTDILGFMTVVADASSLYNVLTSREGLDTTGLILLVRPDNADNRFPAPHAPASPGHTVNVSALGTVAMDFVFKPTPIAGQDDRHSAYNKNGASFPLESYPAVRNSFATANPAINNATSDLSTSNEQGYNVAVGVARPQTTLVDWSLVVEQTHDEAWAPVIQLRNILLACVFGTAGFIALLVIPMAHFSVMPIRRLKDATKHSVMPHGLTPNGSIMSEHDDDDDEAPGDEENTRSVSQRSKRKGISVYLRRLRRGRTKSHAERSEDARRRVFKIPAKVQDRKHFVTDELTELTETFNEMTDELMGQYERLEEKVAERTRELELSKKAAEAANESKTLFIANISHELKTPLNGILGMCAVCMGEDDLDRIKRSLQVVYKSGDLLLHLLNDLLTFSKNQIGQSVTLEEKEFSLADIRSQISTIFDKQVREGRINFAVKFASFDGSDLSPDRITDIRAPELPAIGPSGTGRLKDMRLWGDQHRILQVIINLVSNSLKFTPEGGRVDVRIKCLGEAETSSDGSRTDSMGTTTGGKRGSRGRGRRVGSGSNNSVASAGHPGSSSNSKPPGTALQINPMSPTRAVNNIHTRERSPTPPPAGAKTLLFEFEVEDTGPGISPALQERVFEPFVQGDMGMSKKYGGTGLGLSICSQLAKLMGGDITLKSTVGIGSTFTMRIPLKFVKARAPSTASSDMSRPASVFTSDDKVLRRTSRDVSPIRTGLNQDPNPRLVGLSQPFFAAGPPSAPLSPGLRDPLDRSPSRRGPSDKIRVLVAEDNLVNQEVVLRMLKLEDIYNVTIAKDGQEAYDMVKTSMDRGEMYNLIFMDIQMPNLDGLQSTRLIRQMGYSAPIVALTAFAEESNVQECMDSGMDMFLSKPIRRPALKQVLRKFAPIPEESEPGNLTRRNTGEDEITLGQQAESSARALKENEVPPARSEDATNDEVPLQN